MIYDYSAARAVLAEIERHLPVQFHNDVHVGTYANGREEGFTVQANGHRGVRFAFSEYRNTDQIVVYQGHPTGFSLDGSIPSDEIYDNKKLFRYNEAPKAAEHILDQLVKVFEKPVEEAVL